jgi:hypothetical protein
MASQDHHEEIDIGAVLERVKKGYHGLLATGYRAISFVARNWIVLLILLVGGYFLGKFWENSTPDKYQTELIVQNNFNSSAYVYSAIELLNMKYKQADQKFLQANGFDYNQKELADISIAPIVDIIELLAKTETSDRSLDMYMGALNVEEDALTSETFYTHYRYHRISIATSNPNVEETIRKVLDYLNSNELFKKTQQVMYQETVKHIERNETSIANIDAIFDEFSGKNQQVESGSQVFVQTKENNDLDQLIEKKQELIAENEELKKELLKYDSTVTLVNYPSYVVADDLLSKKSLLLPLLLLFFYCLFFLLRNLYLKGKHYANQA